MIAYNRVLDAFRDYGCLVEEKRAGQASVQAPGHSSADRSVSVTSTEGRVLVYSHSDPTEEVLATVGIRPGDLFDDPSGIEYKYGDGRVVRRTPDKRFFQRGNTAGTELFHANLISEANLVYVVEGEQDVHTLESVGVVATSGAGGGKNIKNFDLTPLYGKDVVLVRDNDETGEAWADILWNELAANVNSIKVVLANEGKDASDHIAAGYSVDQFIEDDNFATRIARKKLWETWQSSKDAELGDFVKAMESGLKSIKPIEPLDGKIHEWDEVTDEWWAWYEEPEDQRRVVPTPWAKLNSILAGGFHAGRSYLVAARPGVGKATSMDTLIPTPSGWAKMSELRVGDKVYDDLGRQTAVTGTVTWHDRPLVRVHFSDGTWVDVDPEHEWYTETRRSRKSKQEGERLDRAGRTGMDQRWKCELPSVKSTAEIAKTIRVGSDSRLNHSIPVCGALESDDTNLPIDPYVLGVWLGDGTANSGTVTLNHVDADAILPAVINAGHSYHVVESACRDTTSLYRIDGLTSALRSAGLLGAKHIPESYLRASHRQRLSLLRGIMDTDGHAQKSGSMELCFTNRRLSYDALELIRSLGVIPTITESDAKIYGVKKGRRWRLHFTAPFACFTLPRQNARQNIDVRPTTRRRYITEVENLPGTHSTKCIQVNSESHLFLVGESMVPTHNSNWLGNSALRAALDGHRTAIFSVEMGRIEVVSRFLAAGADANYGQITKRELDAFNMTRIGEFMDSVHGLPLLIGDTPGLTIDRLWKYAETLCSGPDPIDILLLDYAQLLKGASGQSEQQTNAEISLALKTMSREFNIPVVSAVQVNRDSSKEGKPADLTGLRGSGAYEQDADVVVILHPETEQDPSGATVLTGMIDIIMAKNRTGPLQTISMQARPARARIDE